MGKRDNGSSMPDPKFEVEDVNSHWQGVADDLDGTGSKRCGTDTGLNTRKFCEVVGIHPAWEAASCRGESCFPESIQVHGQPRSRVCRIGTPRQSELESGGSGCIRRATLTRSDLAIRRAGSVIPEPIFRSRIDSAWSISFHHSLSASWNAS